tara:strand:+ start:5643 stop:6092 length:450 start_codon:yes stop_codon:yes gene_type:complete
MEEKARLSLIHGSQHSDERGVIRFVNTFDLSPAKRFYTIEHNNTSIIRAWQGHKIEEKYFHTVKGSFMLAGVKIDDWSTPSESLVPEEFILKANDPQVLYVPAGYANGFRALEPDSILLVFSNLNLEEAAQDNYRFDKNLWMDWFHAID